jgi:CubicO group peptidase (beta-lactamase class C family)
VLQLVQAGRLNLQTPIGRYLAGYPIPAAASAVTLHHLLTHTGGTGDIFGDQFRARRLELRTRDDYVKAYATRDLSATEITEATEGNRLSLRG